MSHDHPLRRCTLIHPVSLPCTFYIFLYRVFLLLFLLSWNTKFLILLRTSFSLTIERSKILNTLDTYTEY